MPAEIKNAMSHRKMFLDKFVFLENNFYKNIPQIPQIFRD